MEKVIHLDLRIQAKTIANLHEDFAVEDEHDVVGVPPDIYQPPVMLW